MFPFQSQPEPRPTFEDVFFAHYVRLREWALQLTGRDRTESEDLIQELYVRIAGSGPIGEHIENAEDYLFSILRNLYYARIRRARAIDDLSIVDYDSAKRGLRAVDRQGILFIREDLHCVCDYLCGRKESSRAASIFILRYFLGYFPHEVMKVVQATRVAVDKAIQAIRREARLDLERPGVLRQMRKRKDPRVRVAWSADDSLGLFAALREKIFRSRTGDCFSLDALKERYSRPGCCFTTAELAHLVSCSGCLDRANRLLGLPLLEERSPDEVVRRDTPSGPRGQAGASPTLILSHPRQRRGDAQNLRRKMSRCLEEVKQHRPRRLVIAVDGDIRASQKVTASHSELRAELRPMEKPAFIEVLSEQNVCLAFVMVQALAPEGGLRQMREIELSDGRRMSVAISFTSESPTIQVIYSDPLIAQEDTPDADSTLAHLSGVAALEHVSPLFSSWQLQSGGMAEQLRRRIGRIFSSDMNMLLASAVLLGLCSIACFLFWVRSGPGISPQVLLSRAEQSDAATSRTEQAQVIYQRVRISGRGQVLERSIYRDPRKRLHFRQEHLSPSEKSLKDELSLAGVSWDDPLSAAAYQEWHDRAHITRDTVQETGRNLLTLTTTVSGQAVAKESLTVRESDFHPVARGIVFHDQGQGTATIEIAELSYAVIDAGSLSPELFADPTTSSTTPPVAILPPVVPLPSRAELDLTELLVREKLHELGADLGEDIHITLSPRSVEVSGVASTGELARSIRASLYSMPHVVLALHTPQELRAASVRTMENNLEGSPSNLQPPLLNDLLKQEFPNESERTARVNQLLAEADQCGMRSQALNVLLQRYHTLDNPTVKMIAEDHLRALAQCSGFISGWVDSLPQDTDAQQENPQGLVQSSSPAGMGAELAEVSRGIEDDLSELLVVHSEQGASPRSAAAVVASCRQRLKTIQKIIAALR